MTDESGKNARVRTVTAKEREIVDIALRILWRRQHQELYRFGRELCNDPRLARLALTFSRHDREHIADVVVNDVEAALKLKVEPPHRQRMHHLLISLRQWGCRVWPRSPWPGKASVTDPATLRRAGLQ